MSAAWTTQRTRKGKVGHTYFTPFSFSSRAAPVPFSFSPHTAHFSFSFPPRAQHTPFSFSLRTSAHADKLLNFFKGELVLKNGARVPPPSISFAQAQREWRIVDLDNSGWIYLSKSDVAPTITQSHSQHCLFVTHKSVNRLMLPHEHLMLQGPHPKQLEVASQLFNDRPRTIGELAGKSISRVVLRTICDTLIELWPGHFKT